MNCSNCYSPIPNDSKHCPRCGWELGAGSPTWGHAPINAAGIEQDLNSPGGLRSDYIPLTLRQRLSLLIPLILGGSCGIGLSLLLFTSMERLLQMGVLIWVGLFMLGWIGVWGMMVLWRRLRDLWTGHTHREIRRITNLKQRHNTIGKDYFAAIDGLGLFNVSPQLFHRLQIGEIYLITYSLHSKRLWEAHPASQQPLHR